MAQHAGNLPGWAPGLRANQFQNFVMQGTAPQKYALRTLITQGTAVYAPLKDDDAPIRMLHMAASFTAWSGPNVNSSEYKMIRMGEMYVINLPDALKCNLQESEARFLAGAIQNYNAKDANMLAAATQAWPQGTWLDGTDMSGFRAEQAVWLLGYLTDHFDPLAASVMATEFVTAVCAYCKQGAATGSFLQKVTEGMQNEMQMQVILTTPDVRAFWMRYGPYFDDTAAISFFTRWESFAGNAVRLRTTIQQAAGQSVTCLKEIISSVTDFPDFPWDIVQTVESVQWHAAIAAAREINGKPYYGYKKDLGIVKSTHYSDIAYLAVTLQERVGGKMSFRNYQGLNNRQIKHKNTWDTMVSAYANLKSQQAQAATAAALAANLGLGGGAGPATAAAISGFFHPPPPPPPGGHGGAGHPPPPPSGGQPGHGPQHPPAPGLPPAMGPMLPVNIPVLPGGLQQPVGGVVPPTIGVAGSSSVPIAVGMGSGGGTPPPSTGAGSVVTASVTAPISSHHVPTTQSGGGII